MSCLWGTIHVVLTTLRTLSKPSATTTRKSLENKPWPSEPSEPLKRCDKKGCTFYSFCIQHLFVATDVTGVEAPKWLLVIYRDKCCVLLEDARDMARFTGMSTLVTASIALFLSLISLSIQCAEQHACILAQTCAVVDSYTCSFQNTVTPTGWRLFNTSSTTRTLDSLERGVCAPGMRQNFIDGVLSCVRQRSFPNALNTEIQNPSGTYPHQKACGKWLVSGGVTSTTYWSLFDESNVAEDVMDALYSQFKIRSSLNTPAKFRNACVRMVTSNSAGPAGTSSYQYLVKHMPDASTVEDILRMVGLLASFYCDSPARVGLTYATSFQTGLAVKVTDGTILLPSDIDEHLYSVGVDGTTRREATEFASTIQRQIPGVVQAQHVNEVFKGSLQNGTNTLAANPTVLSGDTPMLSMFIKTVELLGPRKARSYLVGYAARCSFAVRSVVTGEFASARTARSVEKDTYVSLGRLRMRDVDRFVAMTPDHVFNATSTTWTHLRRQTTLASVGRRDATKTCNRAMLASFPDHVDTAVFNLMVPNELYTKIGTMVPIIKFVTRATISGSLFATTFNSAASVAAHVARSQLRVAGAPADTWGGRYSSITRPQITSADGALLIMLKQARALFGDRISLVDGVNNNICSLPPLFSAMSRNAYFLPTHGCAVLLPGILSPPFAGVDYDDASLYSRIGYVIAHEFAHVSAAFTWNKPSMDAMLVDYPRSTHTEAIADLIAAASIRNSGIVNAKLLCDHISQLWCAKTPDLILGGSPSEGSHPGPNVRGDRICRFLDRFFNT